ncbi:class I SAM-dependent methyltransferase [Tunturiibacter gelidoferens]|uniref:S-adenosyl-L-methionine-dependent methyltransferase n=2 Tax=Tunturiibacter gelidiferens TaxID=3069689 RepID=A0AAU7Z2U8_9BACT|nr:class I SAM-dependent methyltransferase [Edaphobacter lichenicola]MBB5340749.1 methyltransferase (TIGR00027 family) [Edaphobacter lichenicola]
MQSASPSRTALRVALRRAAHQLYDAKPLVFEDPVAVPILGDSYAEELRRTPTRNPDRKDRPFSVALRAFLVARSRYAEDTLAQAVSQGVSQYVVLGAGLDTFAHRNPYPQLRVFEVDHPATQQWKRELLESTALTAPENLTYVSVNFEEQTLLDQLEAGGFNAKVPAVFAWLGVVPYLTLEAFRATVGFLTSQAAGSALVLDYGQPRSALPFFEQLAHDSLASRVQQAGEPFKLFFTPAEIAIELSTFRALEDLGSAEINARYFADRADSLKVLGSAGRLLRAWL